jgi:hypothetical protein
MSKIVLSDALVRLLCGGFICNSNDVNHGPWTYVRSWGGTPGTTEFMEIVSILNNGETAEAVRVDGNGITNGTARRDTPLHVVNRLLDFGFSQTASNVLHGGWWWGKELTDTTPPKTVNVLHAAAPVGPMPKHATSLCSSPMRCHGPNRPPGNTPLCPACCVEIVNCVIATPQRRRS